MLLARPLRLAGIVQLATAIALTLAADSEPDHSKHNAVQLEESLVKTCDFKIGGHHFKLCPLFEGDWKSRFKQLEWEEQTPPTVTKTVYKMSLAGPLKVDKTLPEHEQVRLFTHLARSSYFHCHALIIAVNSALRVHGSARQVRYPDFYLTI